jgi:hypothetical protein
MRITTSIIAAASTALLLGACGELAKPPQPDPVVEAPTADEMAGGDEARAAVNDDRADVNDDRADVNDDRAAVNDDRADVNDDRADVNDDRAAVNDDRSMTER